MSVSTPLSEEQIRYLEGMRFINNIDSHLRIVTHVKLIPAAVPLPERVVLLLDVLYNNEKVDTLSFNLHNYSYDEIVHEARNIKDNDYILQQVDNFLAGDIE